MPKTLFLSVRSLSAQFSPRTHTQCAAARGGINELKAAALNTFMDARVCCARAGDKGKIKRRERRKMGWELIIRKQLQQRNGVIERK